MFKKLVLIAVLLIALFALASPVFAIDDPGTYYVDLKYNGEEVGTTKQKPYNTFSEAKHAAQTNRNGGSVYVGTAGIETGWTFVDFYDYVNTSNAGAPISNTALFVLLGLTSLILVAAGLFLMRRARTHLGKPSLTT